MTVRAYLSILFVIMGLNVIGPTHESESLHRALLCFHRMNRTPLIITFFLTCAMCLVAVAVAFLQSLRVVAMARLTGSFSLLDSPHFG